MFAASILAFSSLLVTGCGSSEDPSPSAGPAAGGVSVEQVFTSGTELAVKADFRAMRDSSFYRMVEKKIEQNMDPAMRAESEKMEQKIKELTGLELEDIGSFALAVSNLDAMGDDPAQAKFLGALSLAKPITLEQILAAGQFLAEENNAKFPGAIDGDRLVFPAEAGMPALEMTVIPAGRGAVVLLGDASSVAGGLSGAGRSAVSDLTRTKDGLVSSEAGWLAVKLPASAREGLREMAANPPPMAPGLAALGALESVSMAVGVAEAMEFALGLSLADDGSAAQVRDVIENQLITMVKMFAPMYFQGGVPPMVNSLAAGLDGRRATLSLQLTPQDVEMMQAAAADALGAALGGAMGIP